MSGVQLWEPFDLAIMTGYSLGTARRHYVRNQIRHKKDELIKRNWTPSNKNELNDLIGY